MMGESNPLQNSAENLLCHALSPLNPCIVHFLLLHCHIFGRCASLLFEKMNQRGANVPDGFVCPVSCGSNRAPTGSIICKAPQGLV